jgi:hypothetical protein
VIGDRDPLSPPGLSRDAEAEVADHPSAAAVRLSTERAAQHVDLGGSDLPVEVPDPEIGERNHRPVLSGQERACSRSLPVDVEVNTGTDQDPHCLGMEIIDSAIVTISSWLSM